MQAIDPNNFPLDEDKNGINQTPYFLLQIDVTQDGLGQPDFLRLKNLYKEVEDETKRDYQVFKTHPDYENIQLKVTKGDNT